MPRVFVCLALLFAFAGCGVKLPPVAPERAPPPNPPPKLDCSPQDPDCDRQDPNYRPKKR